MGAFIKKALRYEGVQKFIAIALAVAVCAISIFSGRSALEVNAESAYTQITNSANSITESVADGQEKNRVNTGPHVFAAVTASGTWGTCPWSLSSDGVLTIGAGTGANSSGYGSAPWYSQRANIKSVELTGEVKLPQSVANLFAECRNLTSFDASNLDTSAVTDMNNMFSDFSRLTSLDVSNWDTSAVTNMGYMFAGCTSLTTLDVSNWKTSAVTNMSWVFGNCSKLSALDVSNWDTSAVQDMRYMFRNCSSLTTLDISNWDTGKATSMYGMFEGCRSLTTIDVSNWSTSNVTDMGYMFHGCGKLTALDVSNWNTSRVINMGSMFYGCSSLTTIDTSNWNTSRATNMNWMFVDCSSLTTLGVSNWDTSNVTDMNWMFKGCSSLTTLDVSNWNTGAVQDMSYMFQGCSNLASLDLSKWNTSNVTTMAYTFNGCSSLTYLDVSAWSTGKVTTMQSMFSGCSKLKHMKVGTGFVFSSTGGALPSPSAPNGYYISGWYTAQTGGTRRASAGGKYTIAQTEDIYAQEAPKNYHIFLNNNGGTSKWKDMLTYADAFGSGGINYHISSSTDLGSATKNGYVFDGWEYYPMINYGFNSNRVISYTNSTYTKFGIVIHNSAGKRVETIINTNTLGTAKQDWGCDLDSGTYAIWIGGLTDSGAMRGYKSTASLEKGKTYRIEYNVVSIADGKVTFKDYAFAGPGTMTTNNMIPAGYATNFYADAIWRLPEFVGWNTAPDGSGTTYAPGDALPDANLDLYAQWG